LPEHEEVTFSSAFLQAAYRCVSSAEHAELSALTFCVDGVTVTLNPLHGDASCKRFFRFDYQGQTLILLKMPEHGPSSEEVFVPAPSESQGEIFYQTTRWLQAALPNTPRLYASDAEHRLFVLSDGGGVTLHDVCITDPTDNPRLQSYYRLAIDWIVQLQSQYPTGHTPSMIVNRALSRAELAVECMEFIEYSPSASVNPEVTAYPLKTNLLSLRAQRSNLPDISTLLMPGRLLRCARNDSGFTCRGEQLHPEYENSEIFIKMAVEIASQPQSLIHRDFQSKNILIKDNELVIIDSQDMCMESVYYDLASLLYDPYVTLSQVLIDDCIDYFIETMQQAGLLSESIDSHPKQSIILNAIQRLYKAAGRYQRLNTLKNNKSYLPYYDIATQRIHTLRSQLCLEFIA